MQGWWTFGQAKGLNQRAQPLLSGNDGIVMESENLSFFQQGALVQRFGSQSQSLTSSGFTGVIDWLGRFVTTNGVEERWGAANNAGTAALARRTAGTWAPVSFSDTVVVGDLRYMGAAALTSKYFLAYNSNVNRLHVWDGTSVRRVGFAQASAVTAAALGGTGLTFNRWYRKRVVELDADNTIVRESEASATPVNVSISNKSGVQITRGTVPGEGETDWIVEAAADDGGVPGTFYQIATVDIATLTYDDTNTSITSFDVSPLVGAYIPPPSAKYLLSDTNRILMAGCWETSGDADQTTPKQNRVWYTPVLGSTDIGDDERVPNTIDQKNWIDIGDEGPITGLIGPLYGDIYVFKSNTVGKLVPTGDVTTPYRYIPLTVGIGAVDQRVITSAEQGEGIPAVFFASASSVYMLTSGGITEISDAVSRDLRMNNFTAASSWVAYDPYDKTLKCQTNSGSAVLSGQYYQFSYDLKTKEWSGISIGGGESSWILGRGLLGIDTILGGDGATIRNTVVASNDNGSSRLLLGGQDDTGASLLVANGDVCGVDGPTSFTSRMRVRKFPTPGHFFRIGCPTVIYRNPVGTSGVTGTLMVSYLRQDDVIDTQTVTLEATDADNSVQQVMKSIDGMMQADLGVLDVRLTLSYDGDFLSSVPPSIDAFMIPMSEQEGYAQ